MCQSGCQSKAPVQMGLDLLTPVSPPGLLLGLCPTPSPMLPTAPFLPRRTSRWHLMIWSQPRTTLWPQWTKPAISPW